VQEPSPRNTNVELPPLDMKHMRNSSETFSKIKRHNDSLFSNTLEQSVYEQDKKKFGHLLPKTGVYFLPDERIIMFLR